MKIDEFGWPIKKTKNFKPGIFQCNNIFFLPKFFWRKIFLCIDLSSFDVLDKWYNDKKLQNYTINKFLNFKFIKFPRALFFFIVKLYFKFTNLNIINLKKSDGVLFGPYSNNYSHKIIDFLLRVILLKKTKYKRIFVPKDLKLIFHELKISYFIEKKIIFFDNYKNTIFKNVNYLSHVETRTINLAYKESIKKLKKLINSRLKKKSKNNYILISRANTNRKLLNEDELYKSLKPMGFKKVYFEKLSYKKQIEICLSSKIMIGYHGAGLSNSLFMRKKSYLIEITNKYYDHPFFSVYGKILNLNYKKFTCSKNYKNLSGICDVEEIKNYLQKLCK